MAVRRRIAKRKSTAYRLFVGELVEIMGEFSTPLMDGTVANVRGYMLDHDEEYIFLGANADEVSAAVKKEKVFSIHIIPDKDPAVEMLERMPFPIDDKGVN